MGREGFGIGGGRGREGLKFWEERFQAGLVWGLSIDIWIFQLPFKHFPFRRSTNKVFIIWIFPDIKLRCYVRLCNFHIYWENYVLHKTLKTNVIRGKSYQLINYDLVEDVGSVDHQGEPGGGNVLEGVAEHATNHLPILFRDRIIIQYISPSIWSL